jgi:hypothetical protein
MELAHRWREDIGHVDRVHAVRRRSALTLLGLALSCAVLLAVLASLFEGGMGFLLFDIGEDESKVVVFLKIASFLGTVMFLVFGYLMLSLSNAFTVWVEMPLTGDKDDQWALLQTAVESMFKKEEVPFKKLIQRNPNFVGYFKLPGGMSILLTRTDLVGVEHGGEPVHSMTVALRNINPSNKDRAMEVQRILDSMPYLEILERKVAKEVLGDLRSENP